MQFRGNWCASTHRDRLTACGKNGLGRKLWWTSQSSLTRAGMALEDLPDKPCFTNGGGDAPRAAAPLWISVHPGEPSPGDRHPSGKESDQAMIARILENGQQIHAEAADQVVGHPHLSRRAHRRRQRDEVLRRGTDGYRCGAARRPYTDQVHGEPARTAASARHCAARPRRTRRSRRRGCL